MNILYKNLNGVTNCFSRPNNLQSLYTHISKIENISFDEFYLYTSNTILHSVDKPIPEKVFTVNLAIRVKGGKGGFGANLRSKKFRNVNKKSDQSQSRNLKGQRLFILSLPKQIREELERQKKKQIEKEINQFIQKNNGYIPDEEKFMEKRRQIVQSVEESINYAFANRKRQYRQMSRMRNVKTKNEKQIDDLEIKKETEEEFEIKKEKENEKENEKKIEGLEIKKEKEKEIKVKKENEKENENENEKEKEKEKEKENELSDLESEEDLIFSVKISRKFNPLSFLDDLDDDEDEEEGEEEEKEEKNKNKKTEKESKKQETQNLKRKRSNMKN
ncbi:replication stress response regulator sde2 [Anaeramoeba flamelloides]|uniref:Replication stress response regulator sde2 n=1 Tax=Anaeramoeba flamelloides TaxID=1746091 RepID=A0AAV8ADJ8_9EUKA|nr:replication stress response regulator sde2 [Anaeramoeba flamelloides]